METRQQSYSRMQHCLYIYATSTYHNVYNFSSPSSTKQPILFLETQPHMKVQLTMHNYEDRERFMYMMGIWQNKNSKREAEMKSDKFEIRYHSFLMSLFIIKSILLQQKCYKVNCKIYNLKYSRLLAYSKIQFPLTGFLFIYNLN